MSEWSVISLSLKIALTSTVIGLPFGILLAYGLARRKIRFAFIVENLVQLPLVLPPVVTGLILLKLLGSNGWLGRMIESLGMTIPFTWFGASLAASIVAFPLLVQTMRVAFEQIDPEWEDAGYVYG